MWKMRLALALLLGLIPLSVSGEGEWFGNLFKSVQKREACFAPGDCDAKLGFRCGVVRQIVARIVGGQEASQGQFPWQAQIQRFRNKSFRLACGGTVISQRHVLTAAHCIKSRDVSHYRVIVGRLRSGNKQPGCQEQLLTIEKFEIHPDYSTKSFQNDLALLWVKSPYGQAIHFTDNVQPACLPDSGFSYAQGVVGTVSGWGYLDEKTKEAAESLQYVRVPVTNFERCSQAYRKFVSLNREKQFCAGRGSKKQDACGGDSGGPFVVTMDDQNYLVGIVSFGLGCARESHPGVYVKLSNYISWLMHHIEGKGMASMVTTRSTTTSTMTSTTKRTTKRTTTSTTSTTMGTTSRPSVGGDGNDGGDANIQSESVKTFGPVCRGQFTYLRCKQRQRIHIVSAFYGRTSSGHCSAGSSSSADNRMRRKREIDFNLFARGASEIHCSFPGSTKVVATGCEGRTGCWIYHKMFQSDPCPGKTKYLSIDYECN